MTREEDLRRLVDYGALRNPRLAEFAGFVMTLDPELERARRILEPWGGDVRAALKATHPDAPGGDHELFLEVMKARDVLRLRSGV